MSMVTFKKQQGYQAYNVIVGGEVVGELTALSANWQQHRWGFRPAGEVSLVERFYTLREAKQALASARGVY